jgi:elongation factor Ts
MTEITASLVKELRERSGAGMMECKKALAEHGGDIEAAMEALRKSGLAKADKKAAASPPKAASCWRRRRQGRAGRDQLRDRLRGQGRELPRLRRQGRADRADLGAGDVEALKAASLGGDTVEQARAALIAKVGENVQVRRMVRVDSDNTVAGYVHGGRIGVLVELKGGDAELAKGLAMHIAAMNPPYITGKDVPADFIAKEKEIELAKMSEKDKAKPAEILEKIISGKVAKIVNEVTLTGQPYALDTDKSVDQVLKAAKAEVVSMHRIAVGEGIEKVVEDYAAEVAKAMQV